MLYCSYVGSHQPNSLHTRYWHLFYDMQQTMLMQLNIASIILCSIWNITLGNVATFSVVLFVTFQPGGRVAFFQENSWDFFFNASRSGIRISSALIPQIAYFALLLPLILHFRKKFPLLAKVNKIHIVNQLIITGVTLFLLAHLEQNTYQKSHFIF